MSNISRQAYADMFGPTVGDKVRLADTELWIEVEDDLTTYGEEVKFGGGKVIRDGMGQGQMLAADCVDLSSLRLQQAAGLGSALPWPPGDWRNLQPRHPQQPAGGMGGR